MSVRRTPVVIWVYKEFWGAQAFNLDWTTQIDGWSTQWQWGFYGREDISIPDAGLVVMAVYQTDKRRDDHSRINPSSAKNTMIL